MNNNRNNRRRGRGNRNTGGGANQNRIDSRARGNAPQLLDKYKKLAQDAQHNGDRVQAEYYLQFADHYFRVIADNKARQDEARAKRGDDRSQANDDSDEEDSGAGRSSSAKRGGNKRPRSRRDDTGPQEGTVGVGGEPVSAQDSEDAAAPKRRTRKPKSDDAAGDTLRKPRANGRGRRKAESAEDGSGEIDQSVLPPAISVKAGSDDDDSLEAFG